MTMNSHVDIIYFALFYTKNYSCRILVNLFWKFLFAFYILKQVFKSMTLVIFRRDTMYANRNCTLFAVEFTIP